MVDPLGDGLIAVVPDGFAPAFCAAPALPAPLLIPLLPTVPVDEPVVAPGAVVPVDVVPVPVELAPPLVDCASAKVLVSANAAANPNVAILMNYSLF